MKQSFDEYEWHIIYEGSGSVTGTSWVEEVAYLGNEKWLLRLYDNPAWSLEPEEPMEPEEKTSDGLVSWVESIDTASDEDSTDKPRQNALFRVATNIGAKQCAELLQRLLNEEFQEKLLLVLGPAPDEWQKELFDRYQESKKAGIPHIEGDWESYEKEVVEKLFEHVGNAPSVVDELFWKLFDAPTKITNYSFSMGVNRGLWVANIAIARSNVLRGQGSNITWPPPKEINDSVAAALGYILKRDWVGVFALRPKLT